MVLNEEQQLLKDTIAGFLDEHAPTSALRELRDNPDAPAWQDTLWQQLCKMGVPAAAQPESEGGLGFGWLGQGAILREMGARLTASPLISSVIFAAAVVRHCASAEQAQQWLPGLTEGTEIGCVAFQEKSHFHVDAQLTEGPTGAISGKKMFVPGASKARSLFVTARRNNGDFGIARVTLPLHGVEIAEELLFDGNRYAQVRFDQTEISDVNWLQGTDIEAGFQRAIDEATIALSAEMIGGARALLTHTVDYLCEREQFGVKIGSFQALQHRCAQAYCQLELAESAVLSALTALDNNPTDLRDTASRAKAMVSDAYEHISNEAVQLHGGMGVTDEMDVGLFLKRSRVCNQMFGDANWHRERFASLRGL